MAENGDNVQLDPVNLSKASLQKIRQIVREEIARALPDIRQAVEDILAEHGVIPTAEATEPPPEGSGP